MPILTRNLLILKLAIRILSTSKCMERRLLLPIHRVHGPVPVPAEHSSCSRPHCKAMQSPKAAEGSLAGASGPKEPGCPFLIHLRLGAQEASNPATPAAHGIKGLEGGQPRQTDRQLLENCSLNTLILQPNPTKIRLHPLQQRPTEEPKLPPSPGRKDHRAPQCTCVGTHTHPQGAVRESE